MNILLLYYSPREYLFQAIIFLHKAIRERFMDYSGVIADPGGISMKNNMQSMSQNNGELYNSKEMQYCFKAIKAMRLGNSVNFYSIFEQMPILLQITAFDALPYIRILMLTHIQMASPRSGPDNQLVPRVNFMNLFNLKSVDELKDFLDHVNYSFNIEDNELLSYVDTRLITMEHLSIDTPFLDKNITLRLKQLGRKNIIMGSFESIPPVADIKFESNDSLYHDHSSAKKVLLILYVIKVKRLSSFTLVQF